MANQKISFVQFLFVKLFFWFEKRFWESFAFSIWKKIWREFCGAQTHLSKIKIFSPEIHPPHTWTTLTKSSEPWIKRHGVGPHKYFDPLEEQTKDITEQMTDRQRWWNKLNYFIIFFLCLNKRNTITLIHHMYLLGRRADAWRRGILCK